MQNPIDFSALPKYSLAIGFQLLLFIGLPLVIAGVSPNLGGALLLVGFGLLLYFYWRRELSVSKFALQNNWTLEVVDRRSRSRKITDALLEHAYEVPENDQLSPNMLPGSLIVANSPRNPQSNWIDGQINNLKFQLMFDGFTILRIPLNAQVPNALLRNKYWDVLKDSGDKARFSNPEELTLEGDFNKYFRVYSQKQDEVNLLSFLTPNVMQAMITNGSKFNIELGNGCLFLIDRGVVLTKARAIKLFTAGELVSQQISSQINLSKSP